MKHLTKIPSLMIATLILFNAAAGFAAESEALTAKGIYHDVDRYQRSGLKFRIVLDDDGRDREVSTTYPFHTGDRFTFSFEINRNTYVYVINRTRSSVTSLAAGYQPKRIDRASRLSEPRLLFPTSRAGNNNRLASNKRHAVPNRGYFVMDEESGVEKLYVVISDRRVDFSDFFNVHNGELRRPTSSRISALEAKLDRWQDNALVELVPKGIRHEVDGYGTVVDGSGPAMVEIDLKHYR